MKRRIYMGLALAVMAGIFTGCGSTPAASSPAASTPGISAPAPAAPLSGVVNFDGSTSMEKVIKILSESFQLEHANVTLNYNGSGSSTGIQSVLDGTSDLGLSSRELNAEEKTGGAVAHIVALDGVALVVNPANPVSDLTVEQIAQLASGEITNWKELGGSDAPVAFVGREAGSGTRSAFEEIVGVTDQCVYQAEYSSTGDVIGNVASNPNAIGYASLSALNASVKALKVAGVDCTEPTVQDGSYAIQRPFLLVTKQGQALSGTAQAFLDYAMSDAVADLIIQAGAVPPAP